MRTSEAFQAPPVDVVIPRAFQSRAMACRLIPDNRSSVARFISAASLSRTVTPSAL